MILPHVLDFSLYQTSKAFPVYLLFASFAALSASLFPCMLITDTTQMMVIILPSLMGVCRWSLNSLYGWIFWIKLLYAYDGGKCIAVYQMFRSFLDQMIFNNFIALSSPYISGVITLAISERWSCIWIQDLYTTAALVLLLILDPSVNMAFK